MHFFVFPFRRLIKAADLFYWHRFLSPVLFTYTIALSIYCQFMVSEFSFAIIIEITQINGKQFGKSENFGKRENFEKATILKKRIF